MAAGHGAHVTDTPLPQQVGRCEIERSSDSAAWVPYLATDPVIGRRFTSKLIREEVAKAQRTEPSPAST